MLMVLNGASVLVPRIFYSVKTRRGHRPPSCLLPARRSFMLNDGWASLILTVTAALPVCFDHSVVVVVCMHTCFIDIMHMQASSRHIDIMSTAVMRAAVDFKWKAFGERMWMQEVWEYCEYPCLPCLHCLTMAERRIPRTGVYLRGIYHLFHGRHVPSSR